MIYEILPANYDKLRHTVDCALVFGFHVAELRRSLIFGRRQLGFRLRRLSLQVGNLFGYLKQK